MPLSMAAPGGAYTVTRVRGKEETRRFLASLGFAEGAEIAVVAAMAGNLIVSVKGSRVALSRQTASCILTA